MSVHNGWNPDPQPPPPGVAAWGNSERKDQLIMPPLSVVSGNVLPSHAHSTEASSSASPVHSPPPVPLQLDIADHHVHVEQPVVELSADPPVVIYDVIDVPPTGEVSLVPTVTDLRPPTRPTTLSRLSILPNLFQHLHDYGLF